MLPIARVRGSCRAATRIDRCAPSLVVHREIGADYRGKDVVFIAVVKGGFMFAAGEPRSSTWSQFRETLVRGILVSLIPQPLSGPWHVSFPAIAAGAIGGALVPLGSSFAEAGPQDGVAEAHPGVG